MNDKFCKWCLKPIERDSEFLVTEQWDFLHIECYREYDKVTNFIQLTEELKTEVDESSKEYEEYIKSLQKD